MNSLIESMMQNRGYTLCFFHDMTTKSHPAPFYTDELCKRLQVYHDHQDQLILLVDFDTDGLMTGIESFAGFAELGFHVGLYFLDVSHGYGFRSLDIDRLVAQYPNAKGILTGDVGITCFDGITRAKELGLEVFVTDHHLPDPTNLRYVDADVVVNPMVDVVEAEIEGKDLDQFGGICGAFVMWKVLSHYAMYYTGNDCAYMTSQINRLRVFAGFGTISDAMPLYYENRALVQDMIHICQAVYPNSSELVDPQSFLRLIPGCDQYRRAFFGLYTLLDVFHEKNPALFSTQNTITEDFVGFYLAPTLNSVKRLHQSVELVYGVFFGPTPRENMLTLYELNEKRKVAVGYHMAQMDIRPQPYAPYIYLTDAIGGLRGLLAQQLLDRHHSEHPVIVVAKNPDGSYSGSGRSPMWYKFLEYAASNGWWAAGHNPSFGFGTDSEFGLLELYEFLKTDVDIKRQDLIDRHQFVDFSPDYIVSMSSMSDDFIHFDLEVIEDYLIQKEDLRPFGNGFEKPQGILRIPIHGVEVQLLGKSKQADHHELKPHVKLKLPMGVDVLCWNQGFIFHDHLKEVIPDPKDEAHPKPYFVVDDDFPKQLDILGDFEYNHFRDALRIQFMGSIIASSPDEPDEENKKG